MFLTGNHIDLINEIKNDVPTFQHPIYIPLIRARICGNLDCNAIHESIICPRCGSKEFLFLEPILNGKKKL